MSQSPTSETRDPEQGYLDAWQELAVRIRHGNSFSGREPNSAFLNTGGGRFADLSMMSGLGLPDDGRALAVTDWDRDGDLDLWLSNRTAPRVRLMRNDYADGKASASLALKLEGDPQQRCPRDAIGAVVTVTLPGGQELVRQLSAGAGFLSQSTKWLHFGLGGVGGPVAVAVKWPGSQAEESFGTLDAGRWRIQQGSGRGVADQVAPAALGEGSFTPPDVASGGAVILTEPKEALSPLAYRDWDGGVKTIAPGVPTVVLLWASWCQPCLREMASLVAARRTLDQAGIRLVALNVEEAQAELEGGEAPALPALQKVLQEIGWPYASGRAPARLVKDFDELQRAILYKQEALPLPSSFLWQGGTLRAFYKGALSAETLVEAKRWLGQPAVSGQPTHAVPMKGRWSTQHFVTHPVAIARVYLEDGYIEAARQYLEEAFDDLGGVSNAALRQRQESDLRYMLGETYRLEGKPPGDVMPFYEKALQLNPEHASAALAYARALSAAKRADEAVAVLRGVLAKRPERHDVAVELGNVYQALGRDRESVQTYEGVLRVDAGNFQALNQLCWVYATSAEAQVRSAAKAMPLARRILQRYGSNLHALDTVAAALACGGEFEKAVELMGKAMAMARTRGSRGVISEFQERLSLYQRQRPFVRPSR